MGMTAQNTIVRDLPGPPPLPVDAPELHALAEYVRAGRCALFVGAGLSAGAGLPTWDALMGRLIGRITPWGTAQRVVQDGISIVDDPDEAWKEEDVLAASRALGEAAFRRLLARVRRNSGIESVPQLLALALEVVGRQTAERAELARLLEQKRFPELAGYCRERLGAPAFDAQIRRALVPRRGLPRAHGYIVRTPYSCVVTTNFDSLLEQAYAEYGREGTPRAPTGADLARLGTLLLDGSFFILKAHGDAMRPETMIFSADDYRRVIHSTPAFQAVLNSILMTHAVLFVGYSLSDVNFRLLLDQQLTVFNGTVPPRYALLSGVGMAEEGILWRTARLQVLSYPEGAHEHVERFLKALADASAGAPRGARRTGAKSAHPGGRAAAVRSAPATTLAVAARDAQLIMQLTRRARGREVQHVYAASVGEETLRALSATVTAAIRAHEQRLSATPEIEAVGGALSRCVAPDLVRRLRALPPGAALELVCGEGTHRIPWEWIDVGGKPLCGRQSMWRRAVTLPEAARGYRTITRAGRALVIGDAGSGQPPQFSPLPGAEREAREIAARLRGILPRGAVTLLSREEATRARILHELRSGPHDIIHFGGHAWFTERESYFWAWDQLMLGSELSPLLSRHPPALLVMSTHFTSFVPVGFDDDFTATLLGRASTVSGLAAQHAVGFAEEAMRCGVSSFVGAFGEPTDNDTPDVMIAFYEKLVAGRPAAEALLAARRRALGRGRTMGLLFTLTGYGDLCIGPAETARPPASRAQRSRARAAAPLAR